MHKNRILHNAKEGSPICTFVPLPPSQGPASAAESAPCHCTGIQLLPESSAPFSHLLCKPGLG